MEPIDQWEIKFEEQLGKSFWVRLGLSAVMMAYFWVMVAILWQ